MNQRNVAENFENVRMLGIGEAAQYIGMGRNATRVWMDEIGATRHFGRRVLFDKKVIDRALSEMSEQ